MRPLRLIVIALPLVLIAGAGGAWWWAAIGRHPLRGPAHHDFGWVDFAGTGSTVAHTFRLENVTGRPVTLIKAQPTCSCLEVLVEGPVEVAPDAALEVPLTMAFGEAGYKKKRVALVLDGHAPMSLWIAGTGRRALAVRAMTGMLRLAPGETGQVPLQAEVQGTDDPPPTPELAPPEGMQARFGGWEHVTSNGEGDRAVVRWRGLVEITPDPGTTIRPGTEFGFVIGAVDPFTIMLLPKAE